MTLLEKVQLAVHRTCGRLGYGICRLTYPSKDVSLERVRSVQHSRRMLLTDLEAWTIVSVAKAAEKIPGDAAEVGVFEGASCAMIASALPGKTVYACDTFEGLPAPKLEDSRGVAFHLGDYAADYENVRQYLAQWPNIQIRRGFFPASAPDLEDKRFCFAHLDVDLYESTKACLRWFLPRLVPGGMILSHDYNLASGVRQAFDEVFADKPETVIEMPTNQCLVVKQGKA
jgi:hypothetical protein